MPSIPSIHLHLRTLPLDFTPVVSVSTLIDACEKVFHRAKVPIKVESNRPLVLTEADKDTFTVLRVHSCCSGNAVTAEQKALFAQVASDPKIGALDVVVFLVQDTDKSLSGCAQHPPGRPGAIVTSICDQWTLAHELGHLLKLEHVSNASQLMFNGGMLGVSANPPQLTADEIERISKSPLIR